MSSFKDRLELNWVWIALTLVVGAFAAGWQASIEVADRGQHALLLKHTYVLREELDSGQHVDYVPRAQLNEAVTAKTAQIGALLKEIATLTARIDSLNQEQTKPSARIKSLQTPAVSAASPAHYADLTNYKTLQVLPDEFGIHAPDEPLYPFELRTMDHSPIGAAECTSRVQSIARLYDPQLESRPNGAKFKLILGDNTAVTCNAECQEKGREITCWSIRSSASEQTGRWLSRAIAKTGG